MRKIENDTQDSIFTNKVNKEAEPSKKESANVYKVSFFDRIPFVVKVLVFKYWAFAAIFFFVDMGLGELIHSLPDAWIYIHLIRGVVMGVMLDILVNHFLRAMESSRRESRFHIMYNKKAFYSIFVTIIYCIFLSFAAGFTCAGLVSLIDSPDSAPAFFREPFTFGLVVLAYDFIFQTIKNLILGLFLKHRKGRI